MLSVFVLEYDNSTCYANFDHKSNTGSKIVGFHATNTLKYGLLWLL